MVEQKNAEAQKNHSRENEGRTSLIFVGSESYPQRFCELLINPVFLNRHLRLPLYEWSKTGRHESICPPSQVDCQSQGCKT